MILKEFSKGIWKENPVLVQLLGLCPTLAVTTKVVFGFSMGLATTFVLLSSSIIVSMIRKIVPSQVRIAVFTVIIATFVTVADYFLKAQFPDISKSLGPYIPLIVVNCVILGRQEAFASKQPVHKSALDALGMGLGFTLSLMILAGVREILAFGSFFDINIMPEGYTKWVIMALPAGAFMTLGIIISIFNWVNSSIAKKKTKKEVS